MFQYQREEFRKNNKTIFMCFNNLITQSVADGDIIATLHTDCIPIIDIYGIPLFINNGSFEFGRLDISTNGDIVYHGTTFYNSWVIATGCWMSQ